ncbi:hypothetical protein [Paraburkholderia sp. SIMBA_030]|uniref:hypothetical protein n=1 Tax=Paraburkholderia sp. SIMBA_030 TaxID=3085773 RepID=UPI00397C782F
MTTTHILFLMVLVLIAAAWTSVRVGAIFDAEFELSTPAKDDRVHSGARSRRASRGEQ